MKMQYKGGYKYQLDKTYVHELPDGLIPPDVINTGWCVMDPRGRLRIKKGYTWDGASGPVADTKRNMRASLVHDALYQLMREGYLHMGTLRDVADREFERICIADGVLRAVARVWYLGLKWFAKKAAMKVGRRLVRFAP